jgi:hypothetical protein
MRCADAFQLFRKLFVCIDDLLLANLACTQALQCDCLLLLDVEGPLLRRAFAGDSVGIVFSVNGQPFRDTVRAALSGASGEWWQSVSLSAGVNRVRIRAIDRFSDSLAQTSVTIFHDPGSIDSDGPAIIDVRAEGTPVIQNADNFWNNNSHVG